MNRFRNCIFSFMGPLLLIVSLGCEKTLNQEALAAQEVAKAADARVASLELQLAEIQSAKANLADKVAAEQVAKAQTKALERQLADLKRSAASKHKSAAQLAANPPPNISAPKSMTVDVPAGTPFTVRLGKELTTATVQPGDTWSGTLTEDVVVEGKTVWNTGTDVRGVVTQSIPAGRLSSGQGSLGIKATSLGQDDIDTPAYIMLGDKRGTRNAKFIGGGAALGALIGVLSDGKNQKDHALGGAAIGAAAGTATAAATAETVIKIPAEKTLTFTLAVPEKITRQP